MLQEDVTLPPTLLYVSQLFSYDNELFFHENNYKENIETRHLLDCNVSYDE